jgi:pyruvate/2-oxoglutarate dehydrogenase complex dihydrolipoamide dehydrogenase (E3) component
VASTAGPRSADAHVPVLPDDLFDRQLLANVRPPDWVKPTPQPRYHVVVIGAGTAGLVTAAASAGLGATVALVERGLMGGDCLTVGCVPSKSVIRAARAWHDAAGAHDQFGAPPATGSGEFAVAMARMRRLRAQLSVLDGAPRFRSLGVDVFLAPAAFVDPRTIEVDGHRLSFRRAVVATGARAAMPPIAGLTDAGYLTNESVFNLSALPRRLLVIGAGPIGCEMAQTFARFGSEVTVVEQGDRILLRDEPEAAAIVQRAMARDGVRFRFGAQLTRVERVGEDRIGWIRHDGGEERVMADHVLIAAGRAPNVEGLGLEAGGIAHDARGVVVDDYLRTTNRRVFAAGDVCTRQRFTHVADLQARIVVQNALFASTFHLKYRRASAVLVPWCTYTRPELAHVGMSSADAARAGVAIESITVPLSDVDRAVLDGEDDGLLRIHVRRGTDRIIGATLVADHAGDLISEVTVAMTAGIGLARIGATVHPYPTQGEVWRKAADAWQRARLTPRARGLLGRYFRMFR